MLGAIEVFVDTMKGRLRRRYGIDRLQVVTYPGYCNATTAFVRGRVLIGKDIESSNEDHGAWRNFRNMARRFLSAEIPHARLEVEWQGQAKTIIADQEGYFFERLPLAYPCSAEELEVTLRVKEPAGRQPVETKAPILPVPPSARMIVVSDMDDTVLLTMATKAIRMVRLTLFGNAHTRQPFSGVADWYRELASGKGTPENPFFYVSSSPWNIYDFLEEFLILNGIPHGPMFLRDHGFEARRVNRLDHRSHKLQAIEHLFEVFPGKPFLLIGDSGQKDPEIYQEIVARHATRILGVMIRNVSQLLPVRVAEVERIGREIEGCNCRFALFDRTDKAMDATRDWGLG